MSNVLITLDAGILPIEGARFDGKQWHDDGFTATLLRTRKGTVRVYDESYKGPLVQPARTNKVTCQKSDPTATTNISVTGGTLSVASDPGTLIVDAKLTKQCLTGKLFKWVNATGSTQTATLGGQTGNTNKHCIRSYVNCTGAAGTMSLQGVGSVAIPNQAGLAEYKSENLTPSASTNQMQYTLDDGGTMYFILPQLEEGAFTTSPIAKDSTGADPLTYLTRPADNLTRPTAGTALAALNNWGVRLRFRPTAAGQTAVLWGSYTDADNATRLDLAPTTLTFTKRLAGANHVAQASLTHAADTLYEALIYQHSVHGMGIATRSWSGSAWSAWSEFVTLEDANGIANASIAATYQNGAVNNSSHVSSNIPFVSVIALPASVEPQAWLMSQLAKGRI